MKTRGSFSQRKFQSLSPSAQVKALDKLASVLEKTLADGEPASELTSHVLECVSWMAEPVPENVLRLSQDLASAATTREAQLAITRFKSSLGQSFKDNQIPLKREDGPRFADLNTLERAGKVILILDNLRSAFNVGSIFRSTECLGLGRIWLCGVTATPNDYALRKTARGTASRIDWSHFEETAEAVKQARAEGYRVYALETSAQAESVFAEDFKLPLALVLGNESLGISDEILSLCDRTVCLPVQGWKNSLNVAVACAVCAYQVVFGCPSGH